MPCRTVVQPDGKIIIVGNNATSTLIELVVIRLNANGTLDNSFGTNGTARTNFGDLLSAGVAVAVQPDGKIIVAGVASTGFGSNADFALARFSPNGTLDTGFDGDGKVTTAFGAGFLEFAQSVALQADGKIVAAGYRTDAAETESFFTVARYNTDGSLDNAFDGDGRFFAKVGNNNEPFNNAFALAVQTDGKILVGGGINTGVTATGSFGIIRLNQNGGFDSTFDGDGKAQPTIFGQEEVIHDLKIQADGKIVAVGFSDVDLVGNGNDDYAVLRFNSNGSLDDSFSGDGKTTFSIGADFMIEQAWGTALQTDGKIMVNGFTGKPNPNGDNFLFANITTVRLNPNGSLDQNFGGSAFVSTNLIDPVSLGYGVTVQNDGKILAVGTSGDNDSSTINAGIVIVRYQGDTPAVGRKSLFDFDGDGKADLSVFRPSNGAWYLQQLNNGFVGVAFGQSGDKLVPADYDGDGKTDVAVYRNGSWYLQRSQSGFTGIAFGDGNDVPVPGDYDGDGRSEVAVFRPSNGYWYILNLTNNQFTATLFGVSTDRPVPADYDGDGKTDLAVFRPSNAYWYLNRSQAGFTGILFGDANDKLVPADYDGDGKADIAVFRPSNGVWYLLQSTAGFTGIGFGVGTDVPAAADYDGDGKADLTAVRDGTWYLQRTNAGFIGIGFGTDTDLLVPNSFVR